MAAKKMKKRTVKLLKSEGMWAAVINETYDVLKNEALVLLTKIDNPTDSQGDFAANLLVTLGVQSEYKVKNLSRCGFGCRIYSL